MESDGDLSSGELHPAPARGLPEGTAVGPYVVERLVAVGGYAEVYRGLDTRDSTPVAMKVLRPDVVADPVRARRLTQEASAYRCLRHPRIVALREVVNHQGRVVLVTEWVDGVTLAERIAGGPLSLAEAGPVMLRVAQALAVAHVAGLAHRDLKPENIMVSEGGEVKLLDFGLAKGAGDGEFLPRSWETMEGTIVGTPAYMAPEQVRGEGAGLPADVFACGAIFFEMLTGSSLFLRTTPTATLHAVAESDRVCLPRFPGRAGRRVGRVLRRCLAPDPSRRPADAIELVALLREALADDTSRSWKALAAVIGAIMIAVLAAFLAVVWPPTFRETFLGGLRVHPAEGLSPVLTREGRNFFHVSRDGREIWAVPVRAGNPQLVFAGAQRIGRLAVAPTGQSVVFDCPDDSGERWVWEVAVTGGTPRKVMRGRSPAISPDGTSVACVQAHGVGHDLVISLRDGSDRRVVCTLPGPQSPLALVFLPGGRELLLSATDWLQSSTLVRVEVATGRVASAFEFRGVANPGLALVEPLEAVLWPLQTTVDGSSLLGITHLKRGGFRAIYPGPGRISDPTVSADFERLLFRSVEVQREIVELDVDPNSGNVATTYRPVPNTKGGSQPRVSPDGTWLAFHSGRGDIWLLERATGSSGPFLTTGESSFNPAWSPDGALVAYGCLRKSKIQIWLAGADGSDPQPLTDGEFNDFQPTWHPNRKHIVFVSDRLGRDQLFRLHVASGEVSPLSTGRAVNPAISPDGRFIAFHEPRSLGSGIVRLLTLTDEVSFGEPIWEFAVEVGEWAGAKPRFSADGRWVAFDLPSAPLGADIWAAGVTPDGADHLIKLTEFPFPARTLSWFDWAPDGCLLVALDRQEDRLLLLSDARSWLERALP